ncbi:MAG: helix-turn-helix domain-containing protein [Cellulosilyticaceae bacterium]
MNYNTDFMYHIGNIIYDLRKEANLSQQQICHGLCSDAEYSRIERGEKVPDPFLLEYVLQRLGKSADCFEYVLKDEHYLLYELREQIHQAIRQKEYEVAKERLSFYEKQKGAKKAVHRQYIYKLRALISIKQEGDIVTAMEWITQAITLTIPMSEGEIITSYAISIQELQLILMQIEIKIKQGEEQEAIKEQLDHLIEYVDDHYSDEPEKGKIYPFMVLLLTKITKREEYITLDSICKRAMQILIRNGITINLIEILKLRIEILKDKKEDEENIRKLELQKDALVAITHQYGEEVEEWILVSAVSRAFHLDWEIIKSNRISNNMTQEDVCEDICTQETLSRIETRKRSPHSINFKDLTKKIGVKRELISSCIMASQYIVLEKKRELEWFRHYLKWKEAEQCLKELEMYYFPEVEENEQFFIYQRTMIKFRQEKIDALEALEHLEKALKLTVKNYGEIDLETSMLTKQEVEIICNMANIYAKVNHKDKAIKLMQALLQSFRKGYVDIRYRAKGVLLIMSNLASYLEEIDEFSKAIQLNNEGIQLKLRCGRGNAISRFLTEKAYTIERMKEQGMAYEEEPLEIYKQAFYLTDLFKEEVQHRTLLNHLGKQCDEWYK